MTWADYTILCILLASALIGLVRGFLREVVSVLIWTVGFWLAVRFAHPVGEQLKFIHNPQALELTGFALILVAVLVVGMVVNSLLGKLVETTGAGPGDRALGVLFGAVRGAVIVVALVLVGSLTLLPRPVWWQDSKLIPYAMPLAGVAQRLTAQGSIQGPKWVSVATRH